MKIDLKEIELSFGNQHVTTLEKLKKIVVLNRLRKELDVKFLRELISEVVHDQWMNSSIRLLNEEKISKARKEFWRKECFKDYDDLSEEIKEVDREYADCIIDRIQDYFELKRK